MNRRYLLSAAGLIGAAIISASAANAQATRTWVSGVGDDVNPCSRTAPCKTFAGAISKTAAGGEINCLDPGGFGAVTITKSLTISCPYTEGGALAGGNGIVVNLPAATDVVYLRGLDIFGVNPPSNGVRMIGQGTLHIEDSVIRRFNAVNSAGVSIAPSGAARVYISNSTIATNGNGATGGGIVIQPTGAAGSARVELDNVTLTGNANAAIRVDTTGNTAPAGVQMVIRNSQLSGSTNGLTLTTPVGTTIAQANIFNSQIFNNQPGSGLVVNGANALIRAGGNLIIGNGAALQIAGGGSIRSFGDNRVEGNSNVSTFTAPNLTPQ